MKIVYSLMVIVFSTIFIFYRWGESYYLVGEVKEKYPNPKNPKKYIILVYYEDTNESESIDTDNLNYYLSLELNHKYNFRQTRLNFKK